MPLLDAVASWPVTTAAVAALDRGGGIDTAGPTTQPFAWASVTKIATALASWVALEEGTLVLDDAAGPPGSTVRHLLAHASGLAPDSAAVLAPPGERRIYSNRGFEVVAGMVADRSGLPFERYLAEAVFEPLGMTATRLTGSPASGAEGPLDDLVALARELLAPTLVSAATLDLATRVTFPGLAGVLPGYGRQDPNDWGLGVELRGRKSPHWMPQHASPGTFGHFGRAGGFLWVEPDSGIACACLTDQDFGPWAIDAWPALGDAVLDHRRP